MAADRSLASLGRCEIFTVRTAVDYPTFVVLVTLPNRRGQVMAASWIAVECTDSGAYPTTYASPSDLLDHHPIDQHNAGADPDLDRYQSLVARAVQAAEHDLGLTFATPTCPGTAPHRPDPQLAGHRKNQTQERALE